MSVPTQLATRADVAALLEIPLPKLTWWVVACAPAQRYRRFEIQRRGGGTRTIHAPIKPLKEIQRKLADELTASYEPPGHVHGFVPKRSAVSNAIAHRSREWVLRIDLADFFPSVNFGRVRGLFMAPPFECSPDAATLLAQICCHGGGLPQGAPSSPIVANLICRRLDRELWNLARSERCSVTRYADDICLSTDKLHFPGDLAYVAQGKTVAGSELERVVKGNGFTINAEKSRLMHRTQRQRVTGLVVNEKENLAKEYVRSLRNLLYIWQRYGEEDAIAAWQRAGGHPNWPPSKPASDFASVIRGQVQYLGSVKGWTNQTYLALAGALEDVDDKFVLRHEAPLPVPEKRLRARLLTEGKTDVTHMLAAQRRFHREGQFLELELTADGSSPKGGDRNLLKTCEALALTPQPQPCVCLFDRDTDDVLAKVVDSGEWKDWKNGVVAVALVGHGDERICIETLYDQKSREATDDEGRRFFLMDEFDPDNGHHESEPFNTPYPDRRRLIPDAVYAMDDGRRVSLSKVEFAAAIDGESGNFSDVSFDGFRPTFEVIRRALEAATQSAP